MANKVIDVINDTTGQTGRVTRAGLLRLVDDGWRELTDADRAARNAERHARRQIVTEPLVSDDEIAAALDRARGSSTSADEVEPTPATESLEG